MLILKELRAHSPFTATGALSGIALMLIVTLAGVSRRSMEPVFESCHAAHVFMSAIVTAAMFRRYRRALVLGVIIGYVGSVGLGTLSDIIFPYLGGELLHAHMHFHLAFVTEWWLINPVALAGVAFGLAYPTTKIPHSGHVLLSTWASLFYLTAHAEAAWTVGLLPAVFVLLFLAVWLPCCVSDIVFPLLFVGKGASAHAHHGDRASTHAQAETPRSA